MAFQNFRVGKKLAIGFGVVVGVIVLSSTTISVEVRSLSEVERLHSVASDAIDTFDRARADVSRVQSLVRKLVMSGA